MFGYNEIVDGRYYTSGMEVSLAIGDFANQFFKQVDVIKFDVNKVSKKQLLLVLIFATVSQ